MNIVLTYPSALEFWLNPAHNPSYYEYVKIEAASMESFLETMGADLQEYEDAAYVYQVHFPMHIMVSCQRQRRRSSKCVTHIESWKLPENSIIQVAKDLYVISPELCFVIAARELEFAQLVKLGFDLCAKYRPDPFDSKLQVTIKPMTTVRKIKDYIQSASGIKGIKLARQAIQYVMDDSNSPMETCFALLANLPISRGGFRLPRFSLNGVIHLNAIAASHLGRDSCECDFVWEERRTVGEYDSTQYHLEHRQFLHDKKRMTALVLSGYKVVTITSEHMKSFRDIEKLFCTIRRALGCNPMNKELEKYFELRWKVVHQIVFGREAEV